MASTGVMSERYLRSTHVRFITSRGSSRSSRRVPEAITSTAGYTRLLASLRSSCNSMLPVPLNSSKITSSIFEPVSISAVAMIVSEPFSSVLRAAPKKRLGLCRALASTPPESTLPEAGCTEL